jgi:transcriptional regulator with XRE-family HTH domain
MEPGELLEGAQAGAGLTQDELARRAGTSRTTLSAYEHGRKSPAVATFARLLSEAGCELAAGLTGTGYSIHPDDNARPGAARPASLSRFSAAPVTA